MQVDAEHQEMLDEMKDMAWGNLFEYMIQNDTNWNPNDDYLKKQLMRLKMATAFKLIGLVNDNEIIEVTTQINSELCNWFCKHMGYRPRISRSYTDMNEDIIRYMARVFDEKETLRDVEEVIRVRVTADEKFNPAAMFEKYVYDATSKVLLDKMGY